MCLWGWGNLWVSQRFDLDLSITIFKNPMCTLNYLENYHGKQRRQVDLR